MERVAFWGRALVLAVLFLGGCRLLTSPRVETVPGPETPEVLTRTRGHLLLSAPLGAVDSLSLPDGERRTLRAPLEGRSDPTVHSLGGPDKKGRYVLVDDFMHQEQHALRVMKLDGSTTSILFQRPGGALWHDFIGDHVALSPRRGQVAFLSGLRSVQMRRMKPAER